MARVQGWKHCSSVKYPTTKLGNYFEKYVQRYLEHQGLVFVVANVCYRVGEIDLIMMDNEIIVFVEVRYRSSSLYGGAIYSMGHVKQKRLLITAQHWLAEQSLSIETTPCRFDLVAITGDELQWVMDVIDVALLEEY